MTLSSTQLWQPTRVQDEGRLARAVIACSAYWAGFDMRRLRCRFWYVR